MIKNALTAKKGYQNTLDFGSNLPHFLRTWKERALPLTGQLSGFWVVTVHLAFSTFFYHRKEILVVSELIH
jgi:sulfur transfer protein SufE